MEQQTAELLRAGRRSTINISVDLKSICTRVRDNEQRFEVVEVCRVHFLRGIILGKEVNTKNNWKCNELHE